MIQENIADRLAALEEVDPLAAKQIRKGLDSPESMLFKENNLSETSIHVEKWLKEEKVPDLIIVPGLGSGSEASTLLEILPEETKILILEKSPEKTAAFFSQHKLEEYIIDKRLKLASGENESVVEAHLSVLLDLPKGPSIRIFDLTNVSPEESDIYAKILLNIRNKMRVSILNLGTLICLGPKWQLNTIKNLPVLISNPGISALEKQFQGKPAIVVAAGPSLNSSLPYLKKAKNSFVIISVGTALGPLRKAGIKPDIVMSVDASEKTIPQFNTNCDDLYLGCSLIAHPAVLKKFKGVFSGYGSGNSVGKWANSFGGVNGTLYCGGTVSASSIDLAWRMGCNPIFTAGLDLALESDGTSHASDTMYHGIRIKTKPENLIPVPGNYSDTVTTLIQFRAYIDIIRDYVTNRPNIEFININDRGAKIEGMKVIAPAEIESYTGETFSAISTIDQIFKDYALPKKKTVCKEIEKAMDQINEVIKTATTGAMICNQLIAMLRSPREKDQKNAEEKLETLKEIDTSIMEARESSLLLDMCLRPAFYSTGMKEKEHDKQHYSEATLANRHSRELFQEILKAGSWTRNLLSETLEEIKEGNNKQKQTNNNKTSAEKAVNLHAA